VVGVVPVVRQGIGDFSHGVNSQPCLVLQFQRVRRHMEPGAWVDIERPPICV
jgi:hypothetical protein